MRRSTVITVVLGLTVLAGCGGSNPPAASPAPAYKPPMVNEPAEQPQAVTTETAKPRQSNDEASQGQTTSLTTTEEMPAEEKDGLVDEAPSKEVPVATETTEEKETQEKEELKDEAGDENQSATATEPSTPRRGTGKLLRRLGSSFGRALAKAATTVESPTPSRPAPSLADDPFPNGEPVDDKAKD